ncbi:SDR family oxidoreductase [Arthrobacter sp. zg-Y750]|uniref:SDR family oxidoreductase n=1 Tax=Arthrobacter sp. zg-Y750 TaxID=2894189 RepID=UPI001E2F3E54|nr:SDR family oxidoreductase [Arthrobacter sp. zg-Y750]MCC9177795.1 SDR family oxidoreductase [Arthrobacter sp. zg-Y750]
MTIAVFGATGQLGRLTLAALRDRGVPADGIRALGRNQAVLDQLSEEGFETFRVELDEPDTLRRPLAGVESVLLISASDVGRRVPQHRAAIQAALDAGVRRLVYTSAPGASTVPGISTEHRATEAFLADVGLPATVLRNNWYTENYRADFEQARTDGVILNSARSGGIPSATRADYAEAAAAVLTTAGHEGAVYELAGDTAWTWDGFAAAAAEVLGSPVTYRPVSPDEQRRMLLDAGVPAQMAEAVLAMDANARDGLLEHTTGDLSRLLGRPATPLRDTLKSWA